MIPAARVSAPACQLCLSTHEAVPGRTVKSQGAGNGKQETGSRKQEAGNRRASLARCQIIVAYNLNNAGPLPPLTYFLFATAFLLRLWLLTRRHSVRFQRPACYITPGSGAYKRDKLRSVVAPCAQSSSGVTRLYWSRRTRLEKYIVLRLSPLLFLSLSLSLSRSLSPSAHRI